MSFRDNLQHLRATRNMTQEQLAMLLGVSRQSVTKWEAEKSYPEMDKLLKLCQIFGCSLDDLVTGDLTGRAPEPAVVAVPSGPPTDVCGYDEHMRRFARKIPTGVALIILGVAACAAVGETGPVPGLPEGAVAVAALFVFVVAGLAFIVPAGMDHSAFMRAHPYVEDFYTDEEKARARGRLGVAIVAGVALILAGVMGPVLLAGTEFEDGAAAGFMLALVAAGVWVLVRYGMLCGRTNIEEYNRSASGELEVEAIVNAKIDEAHKEALLGMKREGDRVGAVCGSIMIVATIVGLLLLFVGPASARQWFWLAWPVGGMLCGVATLLINAFGSRD